VKGRGDDRSALALLLLVPAPSLGVLAGLLLFPGTPLGMALFTLSKLWLFGLPLVWTRWVDRKPFGLSPAREGGIGTGLWSGLLIAAGIAGVWILFGDRLVDRDALGSGIRATGLRTPVKFLVGSLYFCLVNAALEEYAWRWFCLERCRALFPTPVAVVLASLFFTLHHFLALRILSSTGTALVASAGVFAGGTLWGWMAVRYRSVRPGFVSHAFADGAIFAIGAAVAFG
jgi:membrane protease YdiL (CAAX protease family)